MAKIYNTNFSSKLILIEKTQRNARASAGLENEKKYETVAKMDAFEPLAHSNIFFKVDNSTL